MAYGTGNKAIENKLIELSQSIQSFEFRGELRRGIAHREAFSKARLFLMPTQISEPFGRTILESISKGTPVIGSSKGALPELIINGVNGYSVNTIDEFEAFLEHEFNYEACFRSAKRFHINFEVEALVSRSMEIIRKGYNSKPYKNSNCYQSQSNTTSNQAKMKISFPNTDALKAPPRQRVADNSKLKIIYRICDHRNGGTKIPQINKRQCFLNFIEVFGNDNLIIVADNTSEATIEFLSRFSNSIERTSLGNSASFIHALNIAVGFDDAQSVYLVEDDYLHLPKGPQYIAEGLERADYVSLYDHADKYMAKSPNPLVSSGGENTKVILTSSSHWKHTNSTTMTFAVKAGTLKADQQVFRHFCNGKIPLDFLIFRKLAEVGRTVMTPIPGRSTHCDEYPSPFIFDSPLPFKTEPIQNSINRQPATGIQVAETILSKGMI